MQMSTEEDNLIERFEEDLAEMERVWSRGGAVTRDPDEVSEAEIDEEMAIFRRAQGVLG